jgi:hypothetical protein
MIEIQPAVWASVVWGTVERDTEEPMHGDAETSSLTGRFSATVQPLAEARGSQPSDYHVVVH